MKMTVGEAVKHLENMKWLKGYNNTTVDGVPLGEVIDGIIAMLKAREPVKPKIVDTAPSKLYRNDMFKNYYCGNCGEFLHKINRIDMFCSQCGRKVKWDD